MENHTVEQWLEHSPYSSDVCTFCKCTFVATSVFRIYFIGLLIVVLVFLNQNNISSILTVSLRDQKKKNHGPHKAGLHFCSWVLIAPVCASIWFHCTCGDIILKMAIMGTLCPGGDILQVLIR